MNRETKTAVVERLKASLESAPAIILTDFQGMTVADTEDLRNKLREVGARYEVVKNTLLRRAVAGTSKELISDHLKGNTAIAWHEEDPVAPAKAIVDFVKGNDKLTVKAGWLSGSVLDLEGVKALSNMPGKDELRAKLLNVMLGVPTKMVRVLAAGPTDFLGVLNARRRQMEEGGEEAAA